MKSKTPESYLIQLALSAVMAALVFVATMIIKIPNPMGGYFNFGDVMVFISALTLGPIVGGFAGGVGSALADAFPPGSVFVPYTLVIKGVEGIIAGVIRNGKDVRRDMVAVVVAGSEMILGYFLAEYYFLQWGFAGALGEIPGNIAQIVIGGVVGVPVAIVIRRRLPEILKY